MLLDDILDLLLLEVFKLILFQVESNLGAAAKRGALGVGGNRESSPTGRFPDVLLVVVVFRHDLNAIGNEVCGVEANTKLSNHGNVGASTNSLHESLPAELGVQQS